MIRAMQRKFPRWTKDQKLKGKIQATGFVQERRKTLGQEHTELVPMFLSNHISNRLSLSFSPLFYFTGKNKLFQFCVGFAFP